MFEAALLPRVVRVTLEDAIARQEVVFKHKVLREQDRARERVAEGVYESMLEREVKLLLKSELELEYFSRLTLDQILTQAASQGIANSYVEEVAINDIASDIVGTVVH